MCSKLELEETPSPQLITQLGEILQELAGRAAPDSPAAALEDAEELGRVLEIGEAALAVLVARVDSSGVYGEQGYPATVSWLRQTVGMTHGRAGERVALARQLPRLEQTRTRLAHGSLSAAYAREISGAVGRLDDEDTVVAEEILLGLVESGAGVREVARAAARIADLVGQHRGREAEPEDGRRGQRRSWLRRSRSLGGGSFIKGWLSALDEATFAQIVDPLTTPTGKDDPRDTAERTADALMSVLAQGGRTSGLTVIADLPALTPHTDTNPDTSAAPQTHNQHTDSRHSGVAPTPGNGWSVGRRDGARLLDGTPLSLAQARRVALAGGISLLLLGKGGHPLYLGRKVRCVTSAQRRVLEALYPTCAVVGCQIPAHLSEIHHLGGGWKFGTPTDIDRLVPACRFHNQWIDDHPHQITEVRDQTGRTHLHIQRLPRGNRHPDPQPPQPPTAQRPTDCTPHSQPQGP
jgi:hypothetical protein